MQPHALHKESVCKEAEGKIVSVDTDGAEAHGHDDVDSAVERVKSGVLRDDIRHCVPGIVDEVTDRAYESQSVEEGGKPGLVFGMCFNPQGFGDDVPEPAG